MNLKRVSNNCLNIPVPGDMEAKSLTPYILVKALQVLFCYRSLIVLIGSNYRASLISVMIFQSSHLSLTIWILAMYLLTDCKNGNKQKRSQRINLSKLKRFRKKEIERWSTRES